MNRKQMILIFAMAILGIVIPSPTAGAFLLGIGVGAFLSIQLSTT
jgi:hypothetical protein